MAAATPTDEGSLRAVADQLGVRPLLVPLRGARAPAGPPSELDPDRPGSWPVLAGSADEPWLPAFTSAERLRAWRAGARFVALPLPDLLTWAQSSGADRVVIDPGSGHAVVLAADDATTSGTPPDTQPLPDTSPAAPPVFGDLHPIRVCSAPLTEEQLSVLDRTFVQEAVARAWAVELHAPDGTVRLALAIDVPPGGQVQELVDRIAAQLQGPLPLGTYMGIDVIALTDESLAREVAGLDDPIHPAETVPPGRVVAPPKRLGRTSPGGSR